MSTYVFPLAKGGFELLVTADFSPSTPDTLEEPGDDESFEIECIQLLAERGGKGRNDLILDVTDLIYDLIGDEGERNEAFNAEAYAAFHEWREAQAEAAAADREG